MQSTTYLAVSQGVVAPQAPVAVHHRHAQALHVQIVHRDDEGARRANPDRVQVLGKVLEGADV